VRGIWAIDQASANARNAQTLHAAHELLITWGIKREKPERNYRKELQKGATENCGRKSEDNQLRKLKVTSPTLGTGGKRLWLLRSRPDQVDRPTMRGGPSRRILTPDTLLENAALQNSSARHDESA
jgi:hypothetical protein